MSGDSPFVIRSGGFGPVLIALIGIGASAVALGAMFQGPGHNNPMIFWPETIFIFGLGLWGLEFFWAQKVEIDRKILRVRSLFGNTIKPSIWQMPLAEIGEVILGTIGQIKKQHPDIVKAPHLQEMIDSYESLRFKGVSMRAAVQFTPLIIIKTKELSRTQAISTKPFTRRSCRELMAAFRARGIKVIGDEKL